MKPLKLIRQMTNKMPNIYNDLAMQRQNSTATWNKDLCYLPINQITDVMAKKHANKIEWNLDVQILAATAPWRLYKQVFRFTPEMEKVLCEQAEDIEIPVEILYQLPFQSIYIQTNGFDFDGFFVHFEQDLRDMNVELRILLCYPDYESPMFVHLEKGGTISDGIEKAKQESIKNVNDGWNPLGLTHNEVMKLLDEIYQKHNELIPKLIQLVLYLCAENKEVTPNPEQEKVYRQPKPQYIKDKVREVKKWDVGVETGIRLRSIYTRHSSNNTHQSGVNCGGRKSPHVRRGHWHHFWTGRKGSEERRRIIKWVAPMFINTDGDIESPFVTVNDIKTNLDEEGK